MTDTTARPAWWPTAEQKARADTASRNGMCAAEDWHPGIPGVDDLPGDDGYTAACGEPATHRLTERYATDDGITTAAMPVCAAHAEAAQAVPPGPHYELLSVEAL